MLFSMAVRIDETNRRIDSVREELTQRIDLVREELTLRINSLKEELTQRIDRLYEVIVRRDEHYKLDERVADLEREVNELKRMPT